jgi:hypothetical protein
VRLALRQPQVFSANKIKLDMFNKKLLTDKHFLKEGLQQPFLVIENALLPDFAEQLYQEMMTSNAWEHSDRNSFSASEQARIPDGYSFTREVIPQASKGLPASVKKLFDYLSSPATLDWITQASGRRCDGFTGACARYYGGNHLTSHNDFYYQKANGNAVTTRTVTFNYYLTKDWDSAWGGNFVWEKPYNKISPSFNALVLFLVSHDSVHHVEKVNDLATNPRLAITGWFTTTRKPHHKILKLSQD